MRTIYLDYNATTPVPTSIREAMAPFLGDHYGNPSSSHALGRACHEAVEDARARVAQLIGAHRDEILFTSGGTESNNLAIKGTAWRPPDVVAGHAILSALEHPAVVEPMRFLERLGYAVSVVPVDRNGVVSAAAVSAALRDDTRLVSIMHANNEIGTLQPLREIVDCCRPRGVSVHTDAAQSVGKVPVRVDDLGVDLLTIAGHKVYAPKGVGALYVRRGSRLEPLLHGAGHEAGLRAGTENVPYIVALGAAADLASAVLEEDRQRIQGLRDRMEQRLLEAIAGLTINGRQAPRLPNTSSVNFPSVIGAELLRRTSELCASTGSACHSGSGSLSATLRAIGLDPRVARGTVRLSLGRFTTERDVDRAVDLLAAAWDSLRTDEECLAS